MRLLVVDDDIAVRMALSMALDGVTILEAWRASGAVSTATEERADAVLVDRRLPDADGLTAVRALRLDPATADLPIVVITAHDDPSERAAAFSAGADEHAVKPLVAEQLLTLVRSIAETPVDQRRLRRTLRRARMHVGREDGGWSDLVAAPEPEDVGRGARKRRWLTRTT